MQGERGRYLLLFSTLLTKLLFHALGGCRAGDATFQGEISQSRDRNPGSETRQNASPVLNLLGCSQREMRSKDAKGNTLSLTVAMTGCCINV